MKSMGLFLSLLALPLLLAFLSASPSPAAEGQKVEGVWKWSFTDQSGNERKRTLKIERSGERLEAVVIGDEGRERKVDEVKVEGDSITVRSTVERDGRTVTVRYSGKIEGDTIKGTAEFGERSRPWEARREAGPKEKDEGWIQLIHGSTLEESGWKLLHNPDEKHKNGWSLKDGVLANAPPSIDIATEKRFSDFDLHVEFRYPKGSNSGVYLRGIYEVQVEDTADRKPGDNGKLDSHISGAIYGQKEPSVNAALPAGEWQTFDIALRGNKVSVVHNGKKVIDGFELKGPTGGAMSIKHGDPGPIRLQGDHGVVEYRNVRIRPVATAPAQV